MSFIPRLSSSFVRSAGLLSAMTALTVAALRFAPHGLPNLPAEIDPAVVAIFVPLCVLMLALMLEALLLTGRDVLPDDAPPMARGISHWPDGDD
jgi:hypothetical protein